MPDWLFGPWELVVCKSKEEQLAKHSLLSIHIESLEIPSVFPYTHRFPLLLNYYNLQFVSTWATFKVSPLDITKVKDLEVQSLKSERTILSMQVPIQ